MCYRYTHKIYLLALANCTWKMVRFCFIDKRKISNLVLAPPPETASRAAVVLPPLLGPSRRLWRRTVRRSSSLSSLLLYRRTRWSLRFFPVQLVVLLHRRYGVHRAEQYFGGDLDASWLGGWTVAGTSPAAC